jgi:DNA-binding protein Fis
MTSKEMLNQAKMVMIERIKAGVKSIYLNKWKDSEGFEDEGYYELEFSEISKRQISVVMEDIHYDCYLEVILDTIIYNEEDGEIYMRGYVEDGGEEIEEIYFDDLNGEDIAKIADAINNSK